MSTKRTVRTKKRDTTERQALRRRLQKFYRRFNKGAWEDCYALIDPELTGRGKVNLDAYSELMQRFKEAYGSVKPRWTDLSLHLDAMPKQRHKRSLTFTYSGRMRRTTFTCSGNAGYNTAASGSRGWSGWSPTDRKRIPDEPDS